MKMFSFNIFLIILVVIVISFTIYQVLDSYVQMCEKFAEETRQKFPKAEVKTETIHQFIHPFIFIFYYCFQHIKSLCILRYYNISRYLEGHEYLIDNLLIAISLTHTTPTRTLFRGGFDGCLFVFSFLSSLFFYFSFLFFYFFIIIPFTSFFI